MARIPLILIVDDEEAVRKMHAAALEGQLYRVAVASNDLEAMVIFDQETPDLVITDCDLGKGMNGFDVAEEIKDKRPSLPIIMITGSDVAKSDKVNCLLKKPVGIDVLFSAVRALLKP